MDIFTPTFNYVNPTDNVFNSTPTENVVDDKQNQSFPENSVYDLSKNHKPEQSDYNQNVTYNKHATSGFNFHFDPPTNLNLVINPSDPVEEAKSHDVYVNQDNYTNYNNDDNDNHKVEEGNDDNYTFYNDQGNEEDNQESNEEDSFSKIEDPDYNPAEDINELLNDIEDDFEASNFQATSTPPPIEDDHWDIVQNDETYEEMTLEKYGGIFLRHMKTILTME